MLYDIVLFKSTKDFGVLPTDIIKAIELLNPGNENRVHFIVRSDKYSPYESICYCNDLAYRIITFEKDRHPEIQQTINALLTSPLKETGSTIFVTDTINDGNPVLHIFCFTV